MTLTVSFDRGPGDKAAVFREPRDVIAARAPRDLPGAFAAMEEARRRGHWLAGFATYELGYCLLEKLSSLLPEDRDLPLLAFGVYDGPAPAPGLPVSSPTLSRPVPRWTAAAYARAFARLQANISAGDVYQVNLTFPLDAWTDALPRDLYAALSRRQPVGEGALVEMEEAAILCRSPELFVEIGASGRILTRPMKGTAPRGNSRAEDEALRAGLAGSEKNRAENLMIVDLLRNDVSRIARIGSVRVPRLFHVETYETVHQMVSEVEGDLRPGTALSEIFEALFPCGSVTGAPKIRAMEIIRELEDGPRGIYCGATGWIAPGGSMRLGVAIRTLTMWPGGRVRLDVGGGVVHDSTGAGEYEEALWKARFADLSPPI